MTFSERPPSKQWAGLKYRGEVFAEVWFKPNGDPFALEFRIPRASFQIPGMGQQLSLENLLLAVAIPPTEVGSWNHGGVSHSGMHGSNPDFRTPLSPPSESVTHLEIRVRLSPPPETAVCMETGDLDVATAIWRDLETRWKAILTLEAALDALRISMESLLLEMENLWKKPLSIEEKTYAPRADVALWNKAKTRVLNALPKMKDFIHRSVWAIGSPERKRLEEIYNTHIQPQVPIPQIDDVLKQLEGLRKDRLGFSAHGKTIYQDCKSISAELQGVLRTLHNNAVNAQKKKDAATAKGRRF